MKLTSQRYEEIKKIVIDTFLKYNVHCIPVNGFELATKMGVILVPYSSRSPMEEFTLIKKSEDGFFIELEDKLYIFYNADIKYERVNYTILHEIGHIVLGHTQDSDLADSEANFFAKYALVPPILVHKLKLTTVEEIMEHFRVSYTAAKIALEYYMKWCISSPYLTDYEITTIKIFDTFPACI